MELGITSPRSRTAPNLRRPRRTAEQEHLARQCGEDRPRIEREGLRATYAGRLISSPAFLILCSFCFTGDELCSARTPSWAQKRVRGQTCSAGSSLRRPQASNSTGAAYAEIGTATGRGRSGRCYKFSRASAPIEATSCTQKLVRGQACSTGSALRRPLEEEVGANSTETKHAEFGTATAGQFAASLKPYGVHQLGLLSWDLGSRECFLSAKDLRYITNVEWIKPMKGYSSEKCLVGQAQVTNKACKGTISAR